MRHGMITWLLWGMAFLPLCGSWCAQATQVAHGLSSAQLTADAPEHACHGGSDAKGSRDFGGVPSGEDSDLPQASCCTGEIAVSADAPVLRAPALLAAFVLPSLSFASEGHGPSRPRALDRPERLESPFRSANPPLLI